MRYQELTDDESEPRPLEKTALPIDSRAQLATRTAFAILLALLALWVASDFLSAMVWAAVIAITTWPVYIRFATLISDDRSPVLAPLLFTLLTGLVLVVPVILTVHQITQGSDAFERTVASDTKILRDNAARVLREARKARLESQRNILIEISATY